MTVNSPLQLCVKGSSSTFLVFTNETERVEQLKKRIEAIDGMPHYLQSLKGTSGYLPSEWTVGQCRLQELDIISVHSACVGGVQINVKAVGKGPSFALDMELSDTVERLKSKIEELQGIPSQDLRLAFRGKTLDNEALLSTIKQLEDKGSATLLMTQKKKPVKVEKKEEKPAPAEPCLNNCGFYGSAATGGYCSSCYKALGLVSEKDEEKKNEIKEEDDGNESDASMDSVKPLQEDKTHCWKCKKKVGLLGFACKCKYVFCANHRYSDKHDCDFDYRKNEREELGKRLEKVEEDKIERL